MKPRKPWLQDLLMLGHVVAVLSSGASRGAAAELADPLSAGIIDFAGRVSRDYWHLFTPVKQFELENLNRELREARQQFGSATEERPKAAAANRMRGASDHLLEIVSRSPRLIRVDLTSSRPSFAPSGPIEQPGETGALLFEVAAGGEGSQFSTAWGDLAAPNRREDVQKERRSHSLVRVDVGVRGTTYAVVGLEHLPVGRTTLLIDFHRPGHAPVRLPLDVTTPPPGRLKLTVLSDDTGKPVPAMVRLMWRTDGRLRRPGNGIEFATQFDQQGGATGERTANLPEPFKGPFWCVPDSFDMTLAPGVWQIGVRRGVEHEAMFEDVVIRSGETMEKTLRPRRWVDMRRQGWWSGDDHVHCRILTSDDARNLMAWIQAEDVHLANVVQMGDIYRTYFQQRGFGPSHRVVDGEYVLAPGQECPRTNDLGHTLAMNITGMIRDSERYFLYDTVFDTVHAQGGLAGYAHVNLGLFHVHRDMALNVPRQKADFVEVLQFANLGTDLYYDFLNLGCKLTASAGSDVPWGGTIGEARVYSYLGKKRFSAEAWFDAFGRGRTFVTSGPMIEFRVDDALPGDELVVKSERKLRVRARAWGNPKNGAPVKLEIVRHGDILRSVESSNSQRPEATLDFTVEPGHGFWIAARAHSRDGTNAHTTPVYVIRDGLRFWKFEDLGRLIGDRLASLVQIEESVAEARRQDGENCLEADHYRKQLALQGPELLKRVELARNVYDELKHTAGAERRRRGILAQ